MIDLQDIQLRYQEKGGETVEALSDVSLQVAAGERVAVIGPSGSGKTSLIRILAGLETVDDGRVMIDGRDLTGGGRTREFARTVGLVSQNYGLVPQLTALQNVLCGRLYEYDATGAMGRFSREDRREAALHLGRLGLADRIHQKTQKLSGGEQQRVGIARVLLQAPKLVLLDEPVSALDVHWASEAIEQIETLHGGDTTMLMVLHDLNAVRKWADRAVFILDGEIVYDGDPDEACRRLEALEDNGGPFRKAEDSRHDEKGGKGVDGHAAGHSEEALPARTRPAATDEKRAIDDALEGPGWTRNAFYATILLALIASYAWAVNGVDLTASRLFGGLEGATGFLTRLFPPDWSVSGTVFDSLVETVQMALIGTTFAAVFSLPLAVLAARNVSPGPVRAVARVILNLLRTVPSIIWGLFFVAMVGLGPLPGILALTFYASGYLGKFYYEGIESIDPKPVRALQTVGASRLHYFRYGVYPQVLPLLVGYTLYMFEYNVRAASILGIVGAGGIGYYLSIYMENFKYDKATTALLMLLVVVTVIDAASSRIRRRLQE